MFDSSARDHTSASTRATTGSAGESRREFPSPLPLPLSDDQVQVSTADVSSVLRVSAASEIRVPVPMMHLTGDIEFFEQERRASILYRLSRNLPDVPVAGIFREYEEYGLPGYTPLDPNQVRTTTAALIQALKYNVHVSEFVLNVKALELLILNNKNETATCAFPRSDEGIAPLLHFLQNNPSLTTLNIRIPPGTKESGYFVGLFSSLCMNMKHKEFGATTATTSTTTNDKRTSIRCPNLQEITLWIPRERPQRLRMMRMMMRRPSSAKPVRAENGTMPSFPSKKMAAACPVSSSVPLLAQNDQLSSSSSDDDDGGDGNEEDYDLSGIAHFVSQQPRVAYVRVQASSLTVRQWAALTRGLAISKSLRHVELRRLEVESTAAPAVAASLSSSSSSTTTAAAAASTSLIAKHLAVLGSGLERLDLHGTSIDVSPFIIGKQQQAGQHAPIETNDVPNRQLTTLSWSSANLVNIQRLMDALSLPTTTLKTLELSHLNLTGPKCRCLADMLRHNTSIQHLNLSRAQLDSVDASHLVAGLVHNQTLRQLNLMDNQVWRSTPNPVNAATSIGPTAADGRTSTVVALSQAPSSTTAASSESSNYYANLGFYSFRDLLRANTKLEILDLSDNGMDTLDQDSRYGILLQGLVQNTNLKSLKVCNQANLFMDTLQTVFGSTPRHFHSSVSQQLGSVLQHNCLQELVLNYNRFEDAHLAEFMAPALRYNTTLRILGLKRIGMGNASLIALARGLRNHPSIESLDVSYNINVTEEGYQALSRTVRTLPRLHTLWFHTLSRHREEDAFAQHRYTLIIAQALEHTTSLRQMSHSEILEDENKFYLLLNRFDRQRLCQMEGHPPGRRSNDDDDDDHHHHHHPPHHQQEGPVNIALWPKLLASMPLDLVSFYVRRNATLLASVSAQTVMPPARSKSRKHGRDDDDDDAAQQATEDDDGGDDDVCSSRFAKLQRTQ